MNMIESKPRLTKVLRYFRVVIFLAVGLLSLQMTFLFAQTMGPETGQERSSRLGELQLDPKPEPQVGDVQMDPARPPEAIQIDGRVEKMEEHLERPPDVQPWNRQPNVDPARAVNPPRGSGEQKQGAPGTLLALTP